MTIEETDFKLTPSSNDASDFWNLELLVTIKATKNEENSAPKQKFKNVGYGIPLISAVKRICNYRIQHKHRGEAITLAQFLKEYIQLLKELKASILDTTSKPQLLD